ncbi:hypothetical protein EUGRSUZ_H02848 [Eucalyptus grandis]|uniref:Uncharacterized protein n=2 Tax=Eucalyptus grandis TaxID=71139 RepID=A0ACC3JSM1_EUCGR|nr:hypothetical protein EUGRSUZ_H02848 [Eucalyptus grandis]
MDNLEQSCLAAGTRVMSIQFLQRALTLLSSFLSNLAATPPPPSPRRVQKHNLPVADKWLDEYMDKSSELWDVCQLLLKSGVSALESSSSSTLNYPLWARAISRCRREAAVLEAQNRRLLQEAGMRQLLQLRYDECSATFANGFFGFRGVLREMHNVNSLLLTVLLSGLVYHRPGEGFFSSRPHRSSHEDEQPRMLPWILASAARLEQSMEMEMNRTGSGGRATIMVEEYRRVKAGMEEIRGCLEEGGKAAEDDGGRMRERVEDLRGCLGVLRDGADGMVWQIDDLFDEITEERKKIFHLCG